MIGESIKSEVLAQKISIGKTRREEQRDLGGASCVGACQESQGYSRAGSSLRTSNGCREEISRKCTISSVLFLCQSNVLYTGIVGQTTEGVSCGTEGPLWPGRHTELGLFRFLLALHDDRMMLIGCSY